MNPINKPAVPAVGWQQARVLEMQAEYADAFDTQTGSYDEMCAAYGEERKMWNSGGPEMEETIEYQIPYEGYTVPVRLLRPVKAEKLPVIFFMHGGGFVEGDNDTHGLVQRKLAAYSGCVVIGIDYFLVPEVRYAIEAEAEEDRLVIKKEVEAGFEKIAVSYPCLITVTKPSFDPRFPTIKSKMAAKKAEINVLAYADLEAGMDNERIGLKGSPTKVKKTFTPEVKTSGVKINEPTSEEGAEKLFAILCEDKVF